MERRCFVVVVPFVLAVSIDGREEREITESDAFSDASLSMSVRKGVGYFTFIRQIDFWAGEQNG